MSVAGLLVGRDQLVILAVATALMALAQAFLRRTRLGIAMRATADNPLLAAVKGVPTERVIALATLGGGALVGSVVLLGLLEGSRFAKDLLPLLTGVRLAAAQQILVGVVLVVLMIRRPEGLLPETPGSE